MYPIHWSRLLTLMLWQLSMTQPVPIDLGLSQ